MFLLEISIGLKMGMGDAAAGRVVQSGRSDGSSRQSTKQWTVQICIRSDLIRAVCAEMNGRSYMHFYYILSLFLRDLGQREDLNKSNNLGKEGKE